MANPNVIILQDPQVGPDPTTMTCPHCHATITTIVENHPSMKTHLFCILICALGCICCGPCVYCVDSCLAKKHTCPNCHQFIGMYDK
ncbi:lipopolysaccharide-induced tumor necrosis factor-alpha factor homolog [Phymastichus coffea]|uniref:lipopolysaccharide-induced tumor necrosis factor-alpha factor homolog n=1 Tax=Phymastichus coffea TaxID=108790 RepID=UPI00273BA81D|nr:lipopolysaccharide-induced tumor necrosis factor-alpha factor homolog [Phymastichus coffea]